MGDLTSGSNKWILIGLFIGYGFFIWFMISLILLIIYQTSTSMIIDGVSATIFYFILLLLWYRKKEQIYRIANLSQWIDNITFLNDKGTVSIRQDRIIDEVSLNTEVETIRNIVEKDFEFYRIRVSLMADAREMKINFPDYDDKKSEITDIFDRYEEIEQKKIIQEFAEEDPLQFKYKFFLVKNIIQNNMKYACECSKVKINIFASQKKIDKKLEEVFFDPEPVELPNIDTTDLEEKKEDLKQTLNDLENEIDSINNIVDTGDGDDDTGDGDGDIVYDDTFKEETEEEEKIIVDKGIVTITEKEEEIQDADELYRKLSARDVDDLIGNVVIISVAGIKENIRDMFTNYYFKVLETNHILSILDKHEVYTVEDLRNCDKVEIAKNIGFTNSEMREFVKYVEKCACDREVKFWEDLLPLEFKKFLLIKMAWCQIVKPQSYVSLVTFAEPIEFVTQKNIIAKPFIHVGQSDTFKDEEVEVVARRFEQAVYILPDEYDKCVKFIPGGTGFLQGYMVYVPMAYATFVLKGWLTNSIPILKILATNYEVQREFDDYKHFLSHELVILKAMVGYINHIKSNTKLLMEQIEYNEKEFESLQEEMERQRQMRLHQLYLKGGGLMTPDMIEGLYDKNKAPPPKKKSNVILYFVIGIVILLLIIALVT